MNNLVQCGRFELPLDHPLVMGIVNLTPDSFSGDGLESDIDRAIAHARFQLESGAHILDVGAESSRPGAIPTPQDVELHRLLPVLEELTTWNVPVSVDTYKPAVMRASLQAGASMINDITGMSNPEALSIVSEADCGVCVMHMQGEPGTMQEAPEYSDVTADVSDFLTLALTRCMNAGVAKERLIVDPGFGFGKSQDHNLAVFASLPSIVARGIPVLAGLSRKSMIGRITGRPVGERLAGSLAAAVMAAEYGAKIIRVHDVAATRDALAVWGAVRKGKR